MSDESALPFVIQIMEGKLAKEQIQAGMPLGAFKLEGRALPYQKISFESIQRTKTTMYPGNPKGSQQVFGVTYPNMTITGMWKARFLGTEYPTDMRALIDRIILEAPTVRVTWGEGVVGDEIFGNAFVRQGLLKRAKWTLERMQDLEWEWEFEWSGTGAAIRAVSGIADQGITDELSDMVDKVDTAVLAVQTFMDRQFARLYQAEDYIKQQISDKTRRLEAIGNGVGSVRDRLAAGASLSEGMIGNLVSLCGMAAEQSQQLIWDVESIPAVLLNGYDRAKDTLQLFVNIYETIRNIGASQDAAAAMRNKYDDLQVPDVIAEVRVPVGTDCRTLSIKYYGTPDDWFQIADYNGFTSSLVPVAPNGPSDNPAYPVMIPRRGLSTAGDIRTRC